MRIILFLISFFIVCRISHADIIPDNSHRVEKCVKIINVDDFPEYSFYAYILYPTGDYIGSYKINSTDCLDKGYKFNSLSILALKKKYLVDKRIDTTTDWLQDQKTLRGTIQMDCGGRYERNDNPISSIDEYYKIIGITDTSVILFKSKELIRFINGQPAVMRTYKYEAGKTYLDTNIEIENDSNFTNGLAEMCSSSEVMNFFVALLYTILIETIVLFIAFKTRFKHLKIKNKLLLLTGIFASFSTLPYVWFVLPNLIQPTMLYMIVSELSVIVIESIIIWKLLTIDYKKAIILSFSCNLISFIVGLIIHMI